MSSPSRVVRTHSAPVHSMYAEQTLGLADIMSAKAHNTKVGFMYGIVKCKKNMA